jgi:hypothetical protein
MILICKLPKDWKPGDFDPFPGGKSAKKMGCLCPYQPLESDDVAFDAACKVHPREWIATR